VREKNTELGDGEVRGIAEAVAIAAIKYADLSSERIKDYVFAFDRMLAFEGNTGPYLLYALVRLHNIFRTAAERGVDADAAMAGAGVEIVEPQEKDLALALLRYPQTVRSAADALEPHRLCGYLYDLATAFSSFYKACPVLKAEGGTLGSRLRLCALTRRLLADGLAVLGLPAVERM
jgi:arginyl-tRNA synthetase